MLNLLRSVNSTSTNPLIKAGSLFNYGHRVHVAHRNNQFGKDIKSFAFEHTDLLFKDTATTNPQYIHPHYTKSKVPSTPSNQDFF